MFLQPSFLFNRAVPKWQAKNVVLFYIQSEKKYQETLLFCLFYKTIHFEHFYEIFTLSL